MNDVLAVGPRGERVVNDVLAVDPRGERAVNEALASPQRAASLCNSVGLDLRPDEAVVFLAAALVVEGARADELRACLRGDAAPSGALESTLRALWLRTGRARSAPAPMPLQPLAPGVLGTAWRRLRTAVSQALRVESE